MPEVRLIVVMGVSGCGKSTLGEWLAGELGTSLLEGDSFHPAENIAKMSQNIPLTDTDRWPWLESMRQTVLTSASAPAPPSVIIISCSALKKAYRNYFRDIPNVVTSFVFLNGSYELILRRLQARKGHYMKPEMLKSQFDALELPIREPDVINVPLENEELSDKLAIFKRLFP